MNKFGVAVVAGKFYPFHSGHRALLDFASLMANSVQVLLVANENETIDPYVRALSIYEEMVRANLRVHIVDDIYTDDTTPESHEYWAELTKATLGFTPDLVVASEEYGRGWAKAMGSSFVMFDKARIEVPVSGTLCRDNAFKTGRFMPPATKRYMLPRVVVLGAESTGTTTLANELGKVYNTKVVPELGRLIEEEARRNGGGGDKSWDDGKFWLVSRGQDAMEERLARQANGVLICDTDSLATALWYKYYSEKDSSVSGLEYDALLAAGLKQAKKHTLYIVTMDDIPFVQDEYESRTGENMRRWHTELFIETLKRFHIPHITVSGSVQDRLTRSINTIDALVDNFDPSVLELNS